MKRSVPATIAFYVGVISLLFGVIDFLFGLQPTIKATPTAFVQLASMWFVIALLCYVHDIYKRVVNK